MATPSTARLMARLTSTAWGASWARVVPPIQSCSKFTLLPTPVAARAINTKGLSPDQLQEKVSQELSESLSKLDNQAEINAELVVDPADPDGDLEIYRGVLATQIKLVKGFSLGTSAIGLACQPVLFIKAQNCASLGLMLGAGAMLSFFTFATPLLIHYVSKKYVTELYYNRVTDTYKAVTYSLLLRKKELTFRLQDVQVPSIPGMFTTFKAKSHPLFVDGEQFYDITHYGKIMGYDKPLDLRWRGDVTQGQAEARDRWEKMSTWQRREEEGK